MFVSQRVAVSRQAVANRAASGLKTAAVTMSSCLATCSCLPVRASQRMTLPGAACQDLCTVGTDRRDKL